MDIHIGGNKTKKNLFYNPSEKLTSEKIFEIYYKLRDYFINEQSKLPELLNNVNISENLLSKVYLNEGHRYALQEFLFLVRAHLTMIDDLRKFLHSVKFIIDRISYLNRKGLNINETSLEIDKYITEFYNLRKINVSVSFFDGGVAILPCESPKACKNCNNKEDFVNDDDGKICMKCYSTSIPITSNSNYVDSKRINLAAPYKYNRTNNFKEYLNQFQRERGNISGTLHDQLTQEFEVFSSNYDTLNGIENQRKRNFINTRFVLFQLLRKNKVDCSHLEFVKSKSDKILTKKIKLDDVAYNRNEDVCKRIFKSLGWSYTDVSTL